MASESEDPAGAEDYNKGIIREYCKSSEQSGYRGYAAMTEVRRTLPFEGDISDVYGRYGPWQRRVFVFAFVVSIFSSWNNLVMTFFAPNIDHWCARPLDVRNVTSVEEWKNWSLPKDLVDGMLQPSRCEVFEFSINRNGTGNSTRRMACDSWEYNNSFYTSTVVDEWNLVCKDEWLISMSQSVYMAGYMTSMLVFGQLSDRFGRRPIIFLALGILLIAGFGCLFTMHFLLFTVLRFFVSMGVSGVGATSFVLLMEMVGPEHRASLGLGFNIGWAVGYIILPALAWLIRQWFYLQLAIMVPCASLVISWRFLPESPRWLLTNELFDKAEDQVLEAANVNGKDIEEAFRLFKQIKDEESQKGYVRDSCKKQRRANIVDLVRTPNMRKNTLNLYLCWFVNSFIYFGLSMNTNDLGGDPFINFFISGAIEFPAYLGAMVIIRKVGRRVPEMAAMLVGGIACILTIPIPDNLLWLKITLAMIGKFCVTASFGILYVFTAEVYPTVVRNIGVGSSSTCARIGSMVAPFVKELGRATHPATPFAVYGGLSVVSGLLVLLLPETYKCKLPNTVEEGEQFGKQVDKKTSNSDEQVFQISVSSEKLELSQEDEDPGRR